VNKYFVLNYGEYEVFFHGDIFRPWLAEVDKVTLDGELYEGADSHKIAAEAIFNLEKVLTDVG
jgi:hypothetical protein